MASESGQEKRETLADIVSEIRAYGAQPPPRLMWLEIADRIEAIDSADAWRGLYTPPVGNAAAMREALIEIEKMAHIDLCNVYPKYRNKFNNLVGGIERIARAALSTPPRNCDVGTAEGQEARYKMTGEVYHTLTLTNALRWAQMPYEAQEGAGE